MNFSIVDTWLILIICAVFIDFLIGDPFGNFHPVVIIGKLIAFLTRVLNKGKYRYIKGFILVLIVLSFTSLIITLFEYLISFNQIIFFILNLWFLSSALAEKSLNLAGKEIKEALDNNDLEKARKLTGYIVGRETNSLKKDELLRAVIETTAENGIDGVIAPLFFMLISLFFVGSNFFLNPLLFVYLYKSTNTMDSMVGYIDEPYTKFGFCAAKLDDYLNYIPARLGALIYLIVGFFLNKDIEKGFKIFLRDRKAHASLNAGYSEAAIAGLLNIQLGGSNVYFGNLHIKPTIGDNNKKLEGKNISETMKIVFLSEIFLILLAIIIYFLIIFLIKIY